MKVCAPGKLILSGEHAVVYGRPALAMAVNRYAIARATSQVLPFVSFDLSNLNYEHRLSFTTLRNLKARIKRKYERFIKGEYTIRDVLHKPVELAQIAFTLFFDALNIKLNHGIKIQVESGIPIGCGMGSSAATILSIAHAIAHHLEVELPQEKFYQLGLEAENLQHGFSSGLDLQVSLQGGCLYMKDRAIEPRALPQMQFYLVNTGTPETTTGECVMGVASRFKDSIIWNDFEAVTKAVDEALQSNFLPDIYRSISENHRLLTEIGVVPVSVQNFIREIEETGGAAKICGAGAVRGESAGIVLVLTNDESQLQKSCDQKGYSLLQAAGEARGVHVV